MKSKSLICVVAGILLLCLFIGVVSALPYGGVVDWQKTLGGSNYDYAYSILPTSDGGAIFAANSWSNDGDLTGLTNNGLSDWWVVKQDSAGVIQWQYLLGSIKDETPFSIKQTSDGGYIIAGTTDNGPNPGAPDVWVVKLDSAGSPQWSQMYGGWYWDIARDIQQTSDGGYIFIAETESDLTGDVPPNHAHDYTDDVWVVKLDSAGVILWSKMFGGDKDDSGRHIWQTADSGYIFTAITKSNGNGDVGPNHDPTGATWDVWVVRLDSTGVIQWQKVLGGSKDDGFWGWEVQETKPDHGYILAGSTESNDGDLSTTTPLGNEDIWVVRLDSTGVIQWQKRLGGSGDDWAMSCQQTIDAGYIVGGSTASSDGDVGPTWHGGTDVWVVKLDYAGSTQMSKVLGADSYDYLESIRQANDGKYILAGETNSDNNGDVGPNHGLADVWVVKLHTVSVPVAAFTASPLSGDPTLSVTFTDASTNFPTAWEWNFGDGGTSNNEDPVHDYASAGIYTVTLKVTNPAGSDTISIPGYIRVGTVTEPKILQNEAVDQVIEKVLGGSTVGKVLQVSKVSISANTNVELWGGIIIESPDYPAWLVFIDDNPEANWEHPVRYVFIYDNDLATAEIPAMSPPAYFELSHAAGEVPDPEGTNSINGGSVGGKSPMVQIMAAGPVACTPDCTHYWALLVDGGYDANSNHKRYYNNMKSMYDTLTTTYGYPKNHIWVLMSDGTNSAADRHYADDANKNPLTDNSPTATDFAGSKAIGPASNTQLTTITLPEIQNTLGTSDNLFIYMTGHGASTTTPATVSAKYWLYNKESISDELFVSKLDGTVNSITIAMDQCFSGGFIDNFAGTGYVGTQKRFIATAANYNEYSWGNAFAYPWIKGLANPVPADTTGDGRASMNEAFTYAYNQDTYGPLGTKKETPQKLTKNLDGTTQFLTDCTATPTIAVMTPSSGDTWYVGTKRTISWKQTGLTGQSATIALYKGSPGTLTKSIATVIMNAAVGSSDWTLPTLTQGTDYWIKITSGTYSGRSTSNFIIKPAGALGKISVTSVPSPAPITFLDTVVQSNIVTPKTFSSVSPGSHTVSVELAGYYPLTSGGVVNPGATLPLNFPLESVGTNEPPYGTMVITSNPAGADILIREVGTARTPGVGTKTNGEIPTDPGTYAVTVKLATYETPAEQTLTFVKGETVYANFPLTQKSTVPAKVLIVPKPLNIGRTGYFLAFVKLPTGYKAADVDAGSVYCENAKALKLVRIKLFPQIFAAIFSRQDLVDYPTSTHQMNVWGAVKKNDDYVPFLGSDTVNVINKKDTSKEDVNNVMTLTDTQIFTKFNKF